MYVLLNCFFANVFIHVYENSRNIIPLKIDRCTEPISSRSSGFGAKKLKKKFVTELEMAPSLNHIYEDNIEYGRAPVGSQIAS